MSTYSTGFLISPYIKHYPIVGRGHRYRPGSDFSLQALSRRCPSLMGLPSLSGGERRSRSPAACATELLSREPWPLSGSLSGNLAEGGVIETQSQSRSIGVQSRLRPCLIHPLLAGAPDQFRSDYLRPDKPALSRLSYRGKKWRREAESNSRGMGYEPMLETNILPALKVAPSERLELPDLPVRSRRPYPVWRRGQNACIPGSVVHGIRDKTQARLVDVAGTDPAHPGLQPSALPAELHIRCWLNACRGDRRVTIPCHEGHNLALYH